MQNNNNENRYGNLLDKYMNGGEKKSYSPMLNKEINKRKEEGESRYGDLLKNAKPNNKIYDDILNVHNSSMKCRQNEEEQERQDQLRRQERIDREQRELQERIDRNNAFVNDMLEKKRAEQAAVEKKKREEAEKADFYKRVERLANIDPHMAEVFIKAQTKF